MSIAGLQQPGLKHTKIRRVGKAVVSNLNGTSPLPAHSRQAVLRIRTPSAGMQVLPDDRNPLPLKT